MGASQIDLTFHRASSQWVTADDFAQESAAAAELLQKLKNGARWTESLQRERLLQSVDKAEKVLSGMTHRAQDARRKALLLSNRAAYRAWGVQLGREYVFLERDGHERARFSVDFLRPVLDMSPGERAVFVCGGSAPTGSRELLILGRDIRTARDTDNNVICLGALLNRRT